MAVLDYSKNFEHAVSYRPIPGEQISGDDHLVKFYSEGNAALFALIDGAGHGQEAHEASSLAVSVLDGAPDSALNSLLELCHQKLHLTRGAAISLAYIQFSGLVMSWAGVGNVEVVLIRKENFPRRETLLLRNGVVGYQLTAPRISQLQLSVGDLLIFATDGLNTTFLDGISFEGSCQSIADSILHQHAKETDDATVLVVRVIRKSV